MIYMEMVIAVYLYHKHHLAVMAMQISYKY